MSAAGVGGISGDPRKGNRARGFADRAKAREVPEPRKLRSSVAARGAARRAVWALTGLLTLLAAVYSLAVPSVYDGLVRATYLPGAYSQDAVAVAAALALLALAITARTDLPRLGLVALGLLGFLAYAYGIYVIERVYNGLYLVYMAVFALSFWGLVYEALALVRENVQVRLPKGVRFVSAAGALLQPLMFYPLWIATLVPLMAARQRIDTTYSIFILDLCLIMPAFLILAVDAFRGGRIGLLLLPAAFVLGFTLILPLAAAEPAKALFGLPFDPGAFWPWLALSVLFLVLGVLHLIKLQASGTPMDRGAGRQQ